MTRKEIKEKIEANHEAIKTLRLENIELIKQGYLLCDNEQWYDEEEVDVLTKRGKKTGEKRLLRMIHWNEDFKDEDTGEVVTIERMQVVRVNGEWQ